MKTQTFQAKKGALVLSHFSCLLALAALAPAASPIDKEIRATVDGVRVDFPGAQPVMINNRVMVPVRGVFEKMDAVVLWDENTKSVIARHGKDRIRLTIESTEATVNGRTVTMDSPPITYGGSTMVPLRFLSESLRADVEWVASSRTVEINTEYAGVPQPEAATYRMTQIEAGTVIPCRLDQTLSSNGSVSGDRFKATIDTSEGSHYQELPKGTVVEGHVDVARARSGNTPGVLGLSFDRIRTPDGKSYKVHGSLIGLDSNSVDNDNGRIYARSGAKDDNLKYVGYGAGAGALVSIVSKGNVINNSLIGGALGYLFGEIQREPSKARNVTADEGTRFGLRLTQELSFRVKN